MTGYVEDMMKESGTIGGARTPTTEGLFDTRDDAVPASEEDRIRFHRLVAKGLYLGKRVRPDFMTALAFLATRVTRCTADDLVILERLWPNYGLGGGTDGTGAQGQEEGSYGAGALG